MAITIGPGPVPRVIDQTSALASTTETHAAIPGLEFEMEAGVEYVIEGWVEAQAAGAPQDMQASVSGPTALTGVWTWWTQPVTDEAFIPAPAGEVLAAAAVTESPVTDIAATTDVGWIQFRAVVSNATATTLAIHGAQGTAGGTTTFTYGHMSVRQRQT